MNISTYKNGMSNKGYPWGLSEEQIEAAQNEYKSGTETFHTLGKKLFGESTGKTYMRARRVVTGEAYSTKPSRKHNPKMARNGNRNKADGLPYPYGLTNNQVNELVSCYAAGKGFGDLGFQYWGDRKSAGYQRARNIVLRAAKNKTVKLRPPARGKKDKNLPYPGAQNLTTTTEIKTFSFEPKQEAVIFADLALLYATRLNASVRKGNTIDVAAHYNRLRGALKELTVSLPKGATGNVENV